MSRFYRKISLLLSLFLILTTIATPIVFADNSDLEGHWSRDEINKMLEKGYLSGYPDGTFQPDVEMSRAQFVSVINKVFEYVEECDISFDDVNANDWFYKDVRIAYKNGYIKGMSKSKFAPNQTIKRQDVAVILARVLGLVEDVSYCDNFTDGSQISDYAKGSVGAIAKAGIMIGNENKTFEPTGNIKRSEIVVAGRASDYKKEHQEQTKPTEPTKPGNPNNDNDKDSDNDNDNELMSIKITSFPKQIYYVGEVLDITGIVVKAVYKNGQETVLDESVIKVTGFDSTKPVIDKEITVKFGEKTTTYKISVKEHSTYDLVKQVGLITNKEIEIKFNSNVANANSKDDFEVYVDEVKTTDFEFLSYFSNMVTLRLKNSIDPAKNVIKVKIVDATISDGTNAADVNKTYTALNVPYYSVQDIGSKSKIVVRASSDVPLDVVKQVSEGINKMVGRSEFMTLEAAKQGLTISVVGPNENVYMIPEYRELYNAVDVATRVTIPGTVEKPIIVTTASDIMRERGSDEYALINDFTKLFLEIGVKVGALNTPLGSIDNPDLYNIYKHLEEAYSNAKSKDLWQNGMTSSIEEYFAKGTMIYYEVTPESEDGSWSNGIGPVSTRLELRTYDRALFDVLVEVYGEFEYISPYRDVETKPWFVGTQANRYGIDGNELPDAAVSEVNLISGNQIEVKFNREVKNAEDADKYKITFTPTGGEAKEISGFSVLPYSWNTITLQLGGWSWNGTEWEWLESPNLLTGPVGTDIKGDNLVKGQYVCTKVTTSGAITTTPTAIAGEIKVEVIGDNITDWSGNPVGNGVYDVVLNPVIGQVKRTDGVGVYVYADKDVAKESIDMAACYIDEILSNKTYGQGIADGINAGNGGLAIIAYGNHAYMQPELRSSYDQFYLYVEGFGGGIAQTSEANINRDKRATRYDNEFILGHEFGHTIHLTGIEKSFPALYKEIQDTYDEVVLGEGLWPTSYAGSNVEEYFATLSNIWHSTMRESTDGTFNGTWCPVNTREELYRYDRKGYDLMKKIYYSGTQTDDEIIKNEKIFIGTPWESYTASNVYDIDCSLYEAETKIVLSNAQFNGITNITVNTNILLDGIKSEDIIITKKSGAVVSAGKITNVIVKANKLSMDLDINEFALETSQGTTIGLKAFGNYDVVNPVPVNINGDTLAQVWDRITTSTPDNNSVWHNIGEETAIKVNQEPYEVPSNGPAYKQVGKIKGLMVVIDFPDAKAMDNTGINGMPGATPKDYGNRIRGHALQTAKDYYDWSIPRANELYNVSSFGHLGLDVTLVENPNDPSGVYTCSNSLYGGLSTDAVGHTGYALDRGGNVNAYVKDALAKAKAQLEAVEGDYDIIYVVAAENSVGISYGPMDTWGGNANSWSGRTDLDAMVRIGNDSYTTWKFKGVNHETGHAIGAPDYYVNAFSGYGGGQCDPVTGKADYYPNVGHWDYMGYINGPAPDMFSWMKWRLGWIRDDQVDIIDSDGTTTHQLAPVEIPGGTKTILIPGQDKGVFYVIENRQIAGIDNTAVTESSPNPDESNTNWNHNYGTFNSPGILMYKMDANISPGALRGILTIVELKPEQTEKELGASLDKSVLGATSGIYEYTDASAGITVKLVNETDSVNTVLVTRNTLEEKFKPVLSDARFIDANTIEFKTNEDLRGITADKIIVKNGTVDVKGVKINQILPRRVRITFNDGQFVDGDSATIMTKAFLFYGDSAESTVSALTVTASAILSEGKFNSLTEIEVKSNVNLKDIKAASIVINKNGTVVPTNNILKAEFDQTTSMLKLTLNATQFTKNADTENVTLSTKMYSNYDPAALNKEMAQFNPPATVIGISNTINLTSMGKAEMTGIEISTPAYKNNYTIGEELRVDGLQVVARYSDNSTEILTIADVNITGFDSSKATENQQLTIEYQGKTTSYTITVTDKPDSIFIDQSSQHKAIYLVGEELNIGGLIVKGMFGAAEKVINISILDITGFDSSVANSKQTLTITYGGKVTTYDITINNIPGIVMDTKSYYKIVNKGVNGLMDSYKGTSIIKWWDYAANPSPDGTNNNAKWKFVDAGNSYYKIMAKSNGNYIKVLGDDLILAIDSNDDSVLWRVDKKGDYYTIVNKSNGNVLTASDSANDSPIEQKPYIEANNNQLWTATIIEVVED